MMGCSFEMRRRTTKHIASGFPTTLQFDMSVDATPFALRRRTAAGRGQITDPTTKMINTIIKLRATTRMAPTDAPDLDVYLPTWSFMLPKGEVTHPYSGEFVSEGVIEALILLEAAEPALLLIDEVQKLGHRGALLNLCVDWGCAAVTRHFTTLLLHHFPGVGLNIARCMMHSWSNWVGDASKRCVRMIQPATTQLTLTKITELAFWETRSILSNSAVCSDLLIKRGKSTNIDIVNEESVVEQRRGKSEEFGTLVSFVCDMFGYGTDLAQGQGGDVRETHDTDFTRIKKKAEKFYWVAGASPKRIVKPGDVISAAVITTEFISLLHSVLGAVKTGNLARWMSMGPSIAALLLLRFAHPTMMEDVFSHCAKKTDGDLLVHIGGGDFVSEDGIVHTPEVLKTYVASLFSILLMTAAPDAVTRFSRRTEGGQKKHSNLEVDAEWVKRFDGSVEKKWRAGRVFCLLTKQLGVGLTGREVMHAYAAWCMGWATTWGQYLNQQGDEKIKNYVGSLLFVLEEAIETCEYDFTHAEFEEKMEHLHGDEGITREQELGHRAITRTIIDDLEECTTNDERIIVLKAWESSVKSLVEYAVRDAYEVRLVLGWIRFGGGARPLAR